MSEGAKTHGGGSVPGRLVVTLAQNAVEGTQEHVATARLRRKPTIMRTTGDAQLDAVLKQFGAKSIRPATGRRRFEHLVQVRMNRRLIVEFPADADLKEIAKAISAVPSVERVEEDPKLATDNIPDDTDYASGTQWHLTQIDIEGAWRRSTGAGVTIGVYDSDGIRTGHPDLAGNHVATDCDHDGDTPTGEHGTQVVGVCAAVTNNATGVAGAGWNARFMAINAGGGTGGAAAMECMVDEGADLIVTSSPAKQDSEPSALGDAVDYAFETGVPVIVSAGNDNHPSKSIPYDQWPAKNPRALAIGNSDQNDARWTTSNYGPWLAVMAPGTSIHTTSGASGYSAPTGTSFATPLVGGVAALMIARNRTIGPRQIYEILRQTTIFPAGTDGSDNRYGNGRIDANKAMNATIGLWKAVRYGAAPDIGAAAAISNSGWWIACYNRSIFVGYRNSFWQKRASFDNSGAARPAVAINDRGDWIACYSRSTFTGNGTGAVRKMVSYSRRSTPGAVAINANGDWICVYSLSCFVGNRTDWSKKMVTYTSVPDVAGDVAINGRGDWVCCYSKSIFVGAGGSAATKMATYNSVAAAAASVGINDAGDWIANYSRSTFVGHRRDSAKKMVTYDRQNTPGAVAINNRGDWICCYSKSTFVGFKSDSAVKMVRYDDVAPARPAVAINGQGDWIVNYSKSTFVGFRTSSGGKMISYARRRVAGDVAINEKGQWIVTYSLSTYIGEKRSWTNKRITYNDVPRTAAAVDINDSGDWISSYSRTTHVGRMSRSSVQAVRHAPEDTSKRDIENGTSFPSSSLPGGPGAVGISRSGDWIACYGRSTSVGTRALYTNTRNF